MIAEQLGGPFDTVLDVGGNVGDFAAWCSRSWPHARIVSFEPLPGAAQASRARAQGMWEVEPYALGAEPGDAVLRWCLNQHTASSLHEHGPVRRQRFGITDSYERVPVKVRRLDDYADRAAGRTLLKVDVEGHELDVLQGAATTLGRVHVAVVEVNTAPVFDGQPRYADVDELLSAAGFVRSGTADVLRDPSGRVVQFDGVWSRR